MHETCFPFEILYVLAYMNQSKTIITILSKSNSHTIVQYLKTWVIFTNRSTKLSLTIVGKSGSEKFCGTGYINESWTKSLSVRLICCIPQIVFGIKRWWTSVYVRVSQTNNLTGCCSHSIRFQPRDCVPSLLLYRSLKKVPKDTFIQF